MSTRPTPLRRFFDRHPNVKRKDFAARCGAVRGHDLPVSRINEWCLSAPGPTSQALLERVSAEYDAEHPVTRKSWQRWRRHEARSSAQQDGNAQPCAGDTRTNQRGAIE